MKPAVLVAFVGIAVAAGVAVGSRALSSSASSGTSITVEPPASSASRGTVVVELFTSQGCSSCPAADKLLSKLGADPSYAGRIVPLAFHVDYWNYIGWSDPFSSKDWTQRQYAYASKLNLNGVYTPQVVVNGSAETVGSNESAVTRDIDQASREPQATLQAAANYAGADEIAVRVDVSPTDGLAASDPVLVVALYENGVETRVLRGENSGRVLTNDFIVRRIEETGIVPDARPGSGREVRFKIDPAWNRAHLGVAAFVQDRSTMRILGATTATPR
ncbi:MAG TPA: DUF1223 domain-containing protein [Blastocatellia bacterium]|nr:DUF1223 domain-containing protein [Blastocatellia bacterium]